MKNMVTGLAAALLALGLHAQQAWPGRDWERAVPETVGVDSRMLLELIDFGEAERMDSLLVTRHGRIVLEAYYAPYAAGMPHAVNSATKAVIGSLAGIAIAQGILPGAETPVTELLPASMAGAARGKEAITLQHLLDMTSGLDWSEPLTDAVPETMLQMARTRDWPRFILQRPMAQPPGSAFNYNSGNSQLVSEILQARSGMTAEAYAARHLFEPIGIREWRWRSDPAGRSTGGWGLYLSPPDMARLGLLYLRRGEWAGRQLVPRAWVDKVFAASVPMHPAPGAAWRYADGWWTLPERDAYLAVGLHRQMIVVMPRAGVVAAVTGRQHYRIEDLLDRLASAMAAHAPLPPNPEAAASLDRRVRAVTVEKADPPSAASPLAATVSGRRWAVEGAPDGIREFVLQFGEQPMLEVEVARGSRASETRRYPLGLQGRFEQGGTAAVPVLSKARWLDDRTLAVEQRFLQDGHTAQIRLVFEGDAVQGDYAHSLGWRARFTARAKP